jgi:hypothetical protein
MKTATVAIFSVFCVFFLAATLFADPWKIDVTANLGTALSSYSNSWVGGQAGSFTWNSQFLGVAERQLSKEFNTQTTLNLQFGQTKVQDETSKEWSIPQISTDLIDAQELMRYTAGLWADPFLSVRAISQFLDESDTLLNRYINPLNVTEALGISRTLIKNEGTTWSSRIGVAARQVINRQQLDTVSLQRQTDVTKDGGAEFDMDLNTVNKHKWASLISSLRVYEAIISSESSSLQGTSQANNWRYPHVVWENTLILSFKKFLMISLVVDADYDSDISSQARLHEAISAGLTYIYSKK